LTVGVGVEVPFMQPVVDARTNAPIKSKGSAYFNGVLMYRFIILAIGFIKTPPCKTLIKEANGSLIIPILSLQML
jgi:hypothetical protein